MSLSRQHRSQATWSWMMRELGLLPFACTLRRACSERRRGDNYGFIAAVSWWGLSLVSRVHPLRGLFASITGRPRATPTRAFNTCAFHSGTIIAQMPPHEKRKSNSDDTCIKRRANIPNNSSSSVTVQASCACCLFSLGLVPHKQTCCVPSSNRGDRRKTEKNDRSLEGARRSNFAMP